MARKEDMRYNKGNRQEKGVFTEIYMGDGVDTNHVSWSYVQLEGSGYTEVGQGGMKTIKMGSN